MKQPKHDLVLRIVKILDVIAVTLLFGAVWMNFYAGRMFGSSFYRRGNWLIILLFLVLFCLFGRTYDAFLISLSSISQMIYSQGLSLFLADFIMYLVILLLARRAVNPVPLILTFLAQLAAASLWSLLSNRWYYSCFPPRRTAVVYDMRKGMEDLISSYGMTKKFDIVVNCSAEECMEADLAPLRDKGLEAVYLCGVHSHERNRILKFCIEEGISAYVIPRVGDVLMSGARRMHMYHLPMLRVDRYNPPPEFVVTKRLFDILASLIAIVITSPIMLITAIAVKADGGPAFYRQVRLTKDGKEFEVLKFRSMRVDAEKDGVARLSTGDKDDRITKVGRIIRKVRIDELPQLFNILSGDMSIVGPRPERPEIAAQYEKEMPEFRLRLQAKAGLTGYAQVYGKYNTTPYDKLQMDLMYIANPSVLEDLKICLATVKILFMPESTEGVAEGQITADAADQADAADAADGDGAPESLSGKRQEDPAGRTRQEEE